jgi:uncharacterized SAM-binding protein YcdF (DUF218 family)
MGFVIKHWLETLLSPMMLSLVLLVSALICRRLKRARAASALLVLCAVIGYGGSIPIVGDVLLRPLERRYPPLPDQATLPPTSYVIVLGAGYEPHDGVPVTAALNADGLARVVEGVALARRIDGARLIVSGGAPPGKTPSARGYADLARELGIPDGSLALIDKPLDTAAEARSVAALIGAAPFILVTSAYHMPRAMLEMRRAGLQPIPAPTGQLVSSLGAGVGAWIPSSGGLKKVERALHEYAGLAVLALRRE